MRKIVALQSELVKGSQAKGAGAVPLNGADIGKPSPVTGSVQSQQTTAPRPLLSANFGNIGNIGNPLQNGARAANLLGRNIISAGDRLRDLIIPDALAAVVSAPAWIPGVGHRRPGVGFDEKKTQRLRAELEDVLASSCPLCESVLVGLDKPFVKEGEDDTTWVL